MQMREQLAQKAPKSTEKPTNHIMKPLNVPKMDNRITLATICENKPAKSEIIKYLQHRRDILIDALENGSDTD